MNLIRSMYALNASSNQPNQGPIDVNGHRAVPRVAEMNGFHPHPHPQALNNQNNNNQNGGQNSPQPSNHSEVTTASSNSDSGIGFHNDFTNISDRIVVVDFPHRNGPNQQRVLPGSMSNAQKSCRLNDRPAPFGIESIRNIRSTIDNHRLLAHASPKPQIFHAKSRSLDYTLTDENQIAGPSRIAGSRVAPVHLIRAMPDRIPSKAKMPLQENCASMPTSPMKCERYETIFGTDSEKTVSDQATDKACIAQSDDDLSENKSNSSAMLIARSCDDIMMSVQSVPQSRKIRQPQFLASFDDVSLLGDAPPPPLPSRSKINSKHPATNDNDNENDDYVFLAPQAPPITKKNKKKHKKLTDPPEKTNTSIIDEILSYKLSPKVFGVAKPQHGSNSKLSKAKRCLSIELKENCDKNVCSIKNRDFSVWGSLQDFEMLNRLDISQETASRRDFLEPAYSEPDLLVSKFKVFIFSCF